MKIDNFQTFLDVKFETVLSSKCGDRQLEIKDKRYLVSLSSSQTTDFNRARVKGNFSPE